MEVQGPGRLAGEISGGLVALAESLDFVVLWSSSSFLALISRRYIGSQASSLFILFVGNIERSQSISSTISRPF